ncbi:Mitochondrial carrier protein MTM1 [Cocos nucifera]|uniref:Mitochondrial carrier protein MTM1 n=1 Tax=Cocos nucifera TaxID=13894 RepID=A0A8K0NBU3_COCNU|nr:Mitochondrial carrier protein MTM1 [Cocos nucifera]
MSAASSVDFEGAANLSRSDASPSSPPHRRSSYSDADTGFGVRALSAAGAAFLSAILMNPLDVVKTRLQAQAAGVPYYPSQHQYGRQLTSLGPDTILSDIRCFPSCARGGIFESGPVCPDCFQYKGTMDVFYKVVRQEGFARLWRGTNAALALAVPTAYKEFRNGAKPPGMWKTLLGVLSAHKSASAHQNLQSYRIMWMGVGAQLARDVPFSAICWSTLEPIRRRLLALVGEEGNASSILGANFSAGFVAGSLAAAATCPLDVAKTRRQIEKDPSRALKMTTRQTLVEMWRNGGLRGLFTGVGPRVGRAGPSVGIVVSFYEVVKYVLHQRRMSS